MPPVKFFSKVGAHILIGQQDKRGSLIRGNEMITSSCQGSPVDQGPAFLRRAGGQP